MYATVPPDGCKVVLAYVFHTTRHFSKINAESGADFPGAVCATVGTEIGSVGAGHPEELVPTSCCHHLTQAFLGYEWLKFLGLKQK